MIKARTRGEHDLSRYMDALSISDETGVNYIDIFFDRRRKDDLINISVSLPEFSGTRCYSVNFDWLVDHLRTLEPMRDPP